MAQAQGKMVQAALQGAGLRLCPILMTFAFGAGVIPLVFAFGAGAVSQQEIGISVLGGVIFDNIAIDIYSIYVCTGYCVCSSLNIKLETTEYTVFKIQCK